MTVFVLPFLYSLPLLPLGRYYFCFVVTDFYCHIIAFIVVVVVILNIMRKIFPSIPNQERASEKYGDDPNANLLLSTR